MDLGSEIQKTNVGIRISIIEIHACQFSGKTQNFDLFNPNLPKNEFWGQKFKNRSPDSESALPRYHCVNFQLKRTTLTFLVQICPKRKLGFEIQKTNVGIRISILQIPCVPIFRQNGQLWIFGSKFAQKWILGSKFQKSKSGFGISILEILCAPIFRQNGQLWIFGPKFAQKWILGSKFQKSKSGFGISILEILCAPIFRQNGQLWIFWPKFAQKWLLGSKI